MAALTWRNVDSPDFAGVGYNIRTFSDLLGNATDKLSSSLGAFKESANQDAGNAVLARALQYQDPNTYRQALSEGTLFQGIDPSAVSLDTLKSLNTRAGDLLNQATAQQNLSDMQYSSEQARIFDPLRLATARHKLSDMQYSSNQRRVDDSLRLLFDQQKLDDIKYTSERGRTLDTKLDAAGPALLAMSQAYQSGDPRKIAQVQQQYGDVLSSLPAGKGLDVMQKLQGFEAGGLSNIDRRFNTGVAQRDDADTQMAKQVLASVRRGALNPQDALASVEPIMGKLTPGAQALVMQGLDKVFPGTYAGGAGGGQPGTQSGSPYDATFKFTSTGNNSITSMPLGDVIDFQENTLYPKTGGTPVGAFQITKDTLDYFAPRVLGSDWKDQPLTPENQHKIAKAIFDSRKGNTNMLKTWPTLKDAIPNSSEPGAFKDINFEDVAPYIASKEVGAKPHQLTSADRGASLINQAAIGTRAMQNAAVGITSDYLSTLPDTTPIGQVAKVLSENDFQGADKNWVVGQLRKVMNQSGMSAPMAARVLQRSLTQGSEGILGFFGSGSGGLDVDKDLRNEILAGYARGEPIEQAVSNIGVQEAAAAIPQAMANYQQAMQEFQQLKSRVDAGQTHLQPLLNDRIAKLERAKQMLDYTNNQLNQNPTLLAPRNVAKEREKDKSKSNKARKQGTQAAAYISALVP